MKKIILVLSTALLVLSSCSKFLMGLLVVAMFGAGVAVSCTKAEPEAGLEVPIEFGVTSEALTKATVVDASSLASTGFYVNATTGTLGSETAVWTNARFTVSGDRYRSEGKVWPEGADPHYRFYASNVSLTHGASGPTISATNTTDVVVAINDSPAYKTANGLSFSHVFGRIGSVVVEAESGFTISGINIRITPVTGGTYNLREGAGHTDRTGWAGLVTGSATTIATAVGGNPNDLYVVPGTYTLTATWTASKNGGFHTFTDKTVDVTVSAGMHNTITLTLGGGNLKYVPSFSVSASKRVEFAPGNLQAAYNGSTWAWKFADHQWDYVGNAEGNTKVSLTAPYVSGYSGTSTTVDLFGWVGASSTWSDVNQYGITSSTVSNSTNGYGNVTTESLKCDWGSIPGVESSCGIGWRAPTGDEWDYVVSTRSSAATVNSVPNARYTLACINTDGTAVNGMILFPDGVSISTSEATTWGSINRRSAWGTKCTASQWSALEAKGCVFLPAAGYRYGASAYSVSSEGYYWSCTPYPNNVNFSSCMLTFLSNDVTSNSGSFRYNGCSVRLVRNIN